MVIHDLRDMSSATIRIIMRRRIATRVLSNLYPCPDTQWAFIYTSKLFNAIAFVFRAGLNKMGSGRNPVFLLPPFCTRSRER